MQKPYPWPLCPLLRKILHGGLYWIVIKMSKMVEERSFPQRGRKEAKTMSEARGGLGCLSMFPHTCHIQLPRRKNPSLQNLMYFYMQFSSVFHMAKKSLGSLLPGTPAGRRKTKQRRSSRRWIRLSKPTKKNANLAWPEIFSQG